MLYRLRTGGLKGRKCYFWDFWGAREGWDGGVQPRFGPHLFEERFEEIASPEDGCTVYELREEVSDNFFHPNVRPMVKLKKGEVFNADLVLDRPHGDFPIVSQAYKDMVEDIDPNVHQFIPAKIWWNDEVGEIPDVTLYHFICGRIVTLDIGDTQPLPIPEWRKYVIIKDDEKTLIPALLARPSLYENLAQYPLWSFWYRRDSNYISQAFLDEAKARGLTGFEVATKRQTPKDVQYVRSV